MATHEYVWVRGGGQLFLTTKRNNYQKYIQDRVEISDTQFDVRIRIVNQEQSWSTCQGRFYLEFWR